MHKQLLCLWSMGDPSLTLIGQSMANPFIDGNHQQHFSAHRYVVGGISHMGEFKGDLNQNTKMQCIIANQSLDIVTALLCHFLASTEIYQFTLPDMLCLCSPCELS